MTTQTEALKLALEALEKLTDAAEGFSVSGVYFNEELWARKCLDDAYDAMGFAQEALAQPEQEPTNLERHERNVQKFLGTQQPKEPEQDEYLSKAYRLANELRCHLSIAPAPQRTWVGLTPEDYNGIFEQARTGEHAVQLAEAKLKEKNT